MDNLNQIINNASSKISSIEEYTQALLHLQLLGAVEVSWEVLEAYNEINHEIEKYESN